MHVKERFYRPVDLKTNKELQQEFLKELHAQVKEFISDKINLLINVDDRYACVAECKKAFLLAMHFLETKSSFFQVKISELKDNNAIELFNDLINENTKPGKYIKIFYDIEPYRISSGRILNYLDRDTGLHNVINGVERELLNMLELLPLEIREKIYSYVYEDINSLKPLRAVSKSYADKLQHIFNKESILINEANLSKFKDVIDDVLAYIKSGSCVAKSLTLNSYIWPEDFARLADTLNTAPWITSLCIIPYPAYRYPSVLNSLTQDEAISAYVTNICRLIHVSNLDIMHVTDKNLSEICASPTLQKTLKELRLFRAKITDESSIAQLGRLSLTNLKIIKGEVPIECVKMICNSLTLQSTLKDLKLTGSPFSQTPLFTGQNIQSLNMLNLTSLAIGDTGLNELQLNAICNLPNLQKNLTYLDISNNEGLDNKDSLKFLGKLPLSYLRCGSSGYFGNEHLQTICEIPDLRKTLTYLDIRSSGIKLESVKCLNELDLTGLDYRFNQIKNDEELEFFCNLTSIINLTELDISLQEFNDETCLILSGLKNLTKLGLGISQACVNESLKVRLNSIFCAIPGLVIYLGNSEGGQLKFAGFMPAELPNLYRADVDSLWYWT